MVTKNAVAAINMRNKYLDKENGLHAGQCHWAAFVLHFASGFIEFQQMPK